MRIASLLVVLLLVSSGLAAAVEQISKADFEAVIKNKCTVCHTRERIDEALKNGDKLELILEKMLRFGVNVTERDRNVLGTFWGDPLKK